MRAVIYARYSSDNQREASIEGQLRECMEFAAYNDIQVIDTYIVRRASMNKIGRFNKQDIREQCPSLSIHSIEGALRTLIGLGELKHEGSGKSICYYRLK